MNFFDLQINQLMAYGVHIGHTKKNSLNAAAWMIAAFRQNVSVINLWKSLYILKLTFFFVSNIISFLGPIWFVNFNPLAQRYVRACAAVCGEFSVTTKWIRGAVSNFWATFQAYRVVAQVPEVVLPAKFNKFKSFLTQWHFSRFSWPRALFLSNLENSASAAREATALKIPSFGVVDTNSLSQIVSLPIPGNDESVLCLILYNDLLANYILSRKYSMVLMWFVNVRAASRIVSFSNWLKSYYKFTKKPELNTLTSANTTNISTLNNFYKGISIFLSKNFGSQQFFEKLDIFSKEKSINDFSQKSETLLRRRVILNKVLRINFVKKLIFLKKNVIKSKFLTDLTFRQKFLKKNFRLFRYFRGTSSLGKFQSSFIKLNKNVIKNKSSDFFLSLFSDLFFYNKYKTVLAHKALKKSEFSEKSRFQHFQNVVKTIYDKYLPNASLFNNTLQQQDHINSVKLTQFLKILVVSLEKNISQHSMQYSVALLTSFNQLVSDQKKDFTNFKTDFFIKIKADTKYKLRFSLSNFSFDHFVKYSLLWNLRSLLPTPTISKYLVSFYFLGFFKRLPQENVPIVFESFLTQKLRKHLSNIKFKNIKIWMWY